MKTSPLVSVIIPVYNEELYLSHCLQSLKNQTYKNVEIILVDDGSTDASSEVAKQFGVTILKQKHRGAGAARNKGVLFSKGEIIALLDADMKYDKKYIEKLIAPILEGSVVGTFNKEELVANTGNIWSRCWSINSGLPYNRRLPVNYSNTENVFRAIKKSYFIKKRGFNESEGYTDDSSLSKKLNLRSVNAVGAISYHYNPSSLAEVFFSARWIGRGKIYRPNIFNFLRFSPINSIRVGVKYLLHGAPITILLFKLVYDAGAFMGIFFSNNKTYK